jgi:hypothetical protein
MIRKTLESLFWGVAITCINVDAVYSRTHVRALQTTDFVQNYAVGINGATCVNPQVSVLVSAVIDCFGCDDLDIEVDDIVTLDHRILPVLASGQNKSRHLWLKITLGFCFDIHKEKIQIFVLLLVTSPVCLLIIILWLH